MISCQGKQRHAYQEEVRCLSYIVTAADAGISEPVADGHLFRCRVGFAFLVS